MNNLERDSKQCDVLAMETSTQEKTVGDGDWCVPVKHVAKLSRMRGSTSTNTNIKFILDPEEEDRDNDATSDCLGSKQFSLKDDVSHKAVVVRLMACSGNEREISQSRSQVYVLAAGQMQASISSTRAIRTCASFNKTLGRRCQSLWLSIQELEKQSCQWIG